MGRASVDPGAPHRLIGALKRVRDAAQENARAAADAVRKQHEDVRRELSAREARLRQARTELAAARAELAACQGMRDANCTGPAQAVRACEGELTKAERRMQIARDVMATVTAEQDRFNRSRQRHASAMRGHVDDAMRELLAIGSALDAYLLHGGHAPAPSSAQKAAPGAGAAISTAPMATSGSVLAERTGLDISAKVLRQMPSRGWTDELIHEAISTGRRHDAVHWAGGRAATRYVHPSTGSSVIVDNTTGQVIHVGRPEYKYGRSSGDLT